MAKENRPPTLRDWLGFTAPLDFTKARALGGVLGFTLTLVALAFAGLFFLSLAAAGSLVFNVLTSEPATASLGLGALLVALLGAPFLIWRTVVAQRTLDTAQRQTDLQAEAHFNDKINAAATDLAARRQVTRVVGRGKEQRVLTEWQDDLATRAAAIDRLEALALEAMDRNDYAPARRIARMLSTYVRELSREYPAKPAPEFESREQIRTWAATLRPVARPDIERAAQSLGRINPGDDTARTAFNSNNIDLSHCNLQGFELSRGQFSGVRLAGAFMDGSILDATQFHKANLANASLNAVSGIGTSFSNSVLHNAVLKASELLDPIFRGSELSEAILTEAELGWRLRDANPNTIAMLFPTGLLKFPLGSTIDPYSEDGSNYDFLPSASPFYGACIRQNEEHSLMFLRPFWSHMFSDATNSELFASKDPPKHWHQSHLVHAPSDTSISPFHAAWRDWAATLDPPVTIAPDYRRD